MVVLGRGGVSYERGIPVGVAGSYSKPLFTAHPLPWRCTLSPSAAPPFILKDSNPRTTRSFLSSLNSLRQIICLLRAGVDYKFPVN